MPTPADAPLRKITLNLYEADAAIFEDHYGHGWSSYVRDLVNNHAELIRKSVPKPKTLDELDTREYNQEYALLYGPAGQD